MSTAHDLSSVSERILSSVVMGIVKNAEICRIIIAIVIVLYFLKSLLTSKLGSDIMIVTSLLGKDVGGNSMTKEDILKKARIENSGNDPYEERVKDICYHFGSFLMTLTCVVFWGVELYKNDKYDIRFLLIVLIGTSLSDIMKAAMLRNKKHIWKAIRSSALPLVLIIYSIVSKSFYI